MPGALIVGVMGCEGGSIAGRQDLVKVKAKAVVESDPRQGQRERLSTCALTHHPLLPPCVVDQLGALYNKDAIIQHLLSSRSQQPAAAASASSPSSLRALPHIQRLRDVMEAKVSFAMQSAGDRLLVCPVTGVGGTGHHRFVCMRCCGVLLSEQAMREVGTERCLGCGLELQRKEEGLGSEYELWIPVCPGQEEREVLQRRLQLQARKTREDRQQRKGRLPLQHDSAPPQPHCSSNTSSSTTTATSAPSDSPPLPALLPSDPSPNSGKPCSAATNKRRREIAAEEPISCKRREAEGATAPPASQLTPAHASLLLAAVTG